MRNLSYTSLFTFAVFGCFCLFSIVGNCQENYSRHFNQPYHSNAKSYNSDLYFSNSRFHSEAYFSNTKFFGYADFASCEFGREIRFDGAEFHSVATFSYSSFDTVTFGGARFDSVFECLSGDFRSPSAFNWAEFRGTANFSKSQFRQPAGFNFSIFQSTATFSHSGFYLGADFQNVKFNEKAYFHNVQFHEVTSFIDASFNSFAGFIGCYFWGDNNFGYVLLPDSMDFRDVRITKEIDFTRCILDNKKVQRDKDYKCLIALAGSDINKIKINYELFRLWFPGNTSYEVKASTYEKLLKKFEEDGFMESYQLLDIEYKNFRNKHEGHWFLNGFMKYWWNYGYNKEWVVYWSALLFGIFMFVNSFRFQYLNQRVYTIHFEFYSNELFEKRKKQTDLADLFFQKRFLMLPQAVIFGAWNYIGMYVINPFIYTAIIFFGIKIELDRFQKFSILTMYIWLIYMIGLFCLAYIFNIIIVK